MKNRSLQQRKTMWKEKYIFRLFLSKKGALSSLTSSKQIRFVFFPAINFSLLQKR
jgi:hypothetical protein